MRFINGELRISVSAFLLMLVIFLSSLVLNFFQRIQYSELLREYVDTAWKLQNSTVDLEYVQEGYASCQKKLENE